MKRVFSIFILIGVMMFSTTCFASNSSTILIDNLKNDPNYIYIGGVGSGYAILLDKTSINVHEYNPPHYTIAFIRIDYSNIPIREPIEAIKSSVQIYHYDYDTRKIYSEGTNKKRYYVDPIDLSKTNGGRSMLAEAELVFYLAYNMSFFDEPISPKAKEYINTHK